MASDGGKGDKQRPTDMDEFRKNWQRIFGDKNAPVSELKRETDRTHLLDEEDRKRLRDN